MTEAVPARADHDPRRPKLWRALDKEVGWIPAGLPTAFVLCSLKGMTGAEAAGLLGCPHGTVASGLTRARDRLARRGFAPAVTAAAVAAMPRGRLVDAVLTAGRT